MEQSAPKEWIKKRTRTTIAFAIQNVFIGCEYGIFVINLWFYLTEMVKTDYPKMFYSLISVAYLMSAAGSSIVVCNFADKTREIQVNICYILFAINFGAINFGDNIFGGINFGEISTIHQISIEIRSLKIFGWLFLFNT